jgi:two-component system chemotaxis response regulator CheB
MNRIRVLIVDDSALMRRLLRELFASDPQLEVVGVAPDPIVAREKLLTLRPDVMTLDVEMPRMDGLAFLEEVMRANPLPVVMVSSLTERGCEVTLRALELGAVDFVTKPKLDVERGTLDLAETILEKVKGAARARAKRIVRQPPAHLNPFPAPKTAPSFRTTERIVAVGASTGGTEALREVLMALPADAPGMVIVQHMPAVFTRHFAERLNSLCRVRVKEAADGDCITTGQVLIAPGGEHHLEIVRSGATYVARLVPGPPVDHHRPSVDTLFRSAARSAGANAVGAILTGMGADGARGLLAMRKAGAITLAEDESTCVVFGMPKEAIACGAAMHVVPLDRMAGAILRAVREATTARATEERR